MKLNFFLFIIALFLIFELNAQETIVTDRPDMTESAQTLEQFRFQLETGFMLESIQEQSLSFNKVMMPTSLLRFGVTDYLELRFNFAYLRLSEPFNNTFIRGFGDYEAGLKIQVFDDDDVNVKIAFLSHLLLPVGNDLLKTEKFGVINKIAISHELSEVFGISYNIGYDQLSSDIYQLTYSIALAYEYRPNVSFYVEPYGEYVNSLQLKSYFNVGMTYLVSNNFQLDLSYGAAYGKMKLFKMNFIAAGISFRI